VDRQHIVAEIVRTAEQNGGAPLGRARFFEATGIRETDWSGIHWARWSDALAEAGFPANEMQAALEDDYLLERYALLVQDMGRLPVEAELKLARRSDATFPSHNTFRRLGSRREFLLKVAEYCRARDDLNDVASLCEAKALTLPQKTVEPFRAAAGVHGFVYLIKAGRYYKLGKTNAVGRRERELAIQLPEKSQTVHSIRTDDPAGIEAYWHKRFEARRKNGEWFELTAADVSAFRRRKFM
jgi:hypothetical protein